MPYTYAESAVHIPKMAEVTVNFYPQGKFGPIVQEVLDRLEPWEAGEDPIQTFDLPYEVGARTLVLANNETPVWGVNPHHKAKRPGLSPYMGVEKTDGRGRIAIGTLELTGTVERPILTRAYPGDYIPPLPWMGTARNADGGLQACVEYWRRSAYIMRSNNRPAELTYMAPDWYETADLDKM